MLRCSLIGLILFVLAPTAAAQQAPPEPDVPAGTFGQILPPVSADVAAGDDSGSAASSPIESRRLGRFPSLESHTGLFRLYTADSTPLGTFTVGLFGEFFSASDVARSGDETTRFAGRLGVTYRPHRNLELFGGLAALGNSSSLASPELMQSVGDLRLGAKGFAALSHGFSAGGSLTGVFLNGSNSIGFDFGATSVDLRAFATYDLEAASDLPLLLHANTAFYIDNSANLFDVDLQRVERFAHQVSDFHQFRAGVGVEVPLDYITPSLEWSLGVPVGRGDPEQCDENPIPCPHEAGFGSFPQLLTLGLKASPLPSLALNLGLDIGLTTREATGLPGPPPYNLLFGVAYLIDPSPPAPERIEVAVEEPQAWILGQVVDDETGDPIGGAVIAYPGQNLTPQSSDPQTGQFRSYGFPIQTEVAVEVTHPGYEPRGFARMLGDREDGIRIRMVPLQNLSLLSGTVLDAEGNPLPATIYLTGPQTLQLDADPLTSEFLQELPIGHYTLTVVAAGHTSQRQGLDLAPGAQRLEVALAPLAPDQVAVLRGDRIELEGGRVAFSDAGLELEAAAIPILSQVASLLQLHPDISLRVVAHSDDVGTVEHTEAQARHVVALLVGLGVSAERLTAEGAGPQRPRFPNISERNRQRNWRVEFLFR